MGFPLKTTVETTRKRRSTGPRLKGLGDEPGSDQREVDPQRETNWKETLIVLTSVLMLFVNIIYVDYR